MEKNMEKKFLFLILSILHIILILNGCHSGHNVVLTAENVIFDHLNKDSSLGVLVISDERMGQTWYKTQNNWRVETIKNIPETSLYNVWQVEISPQDEYMAVLSEGEGHPIVEIFEINKIFRQRDGLEDEMISPALSVDPYPGTIWIKEWQSDTLLLIDSDIPLTLLDKKERRVPLQDPGLETQEFLWDVSSDTIIRK
jgi:hypothetical protein